MRKEYTSNCSSRNGAEIGGVILHFTAGGDADSTVKWFKHPDSKASAHYVVSRGGEIIQMVDERNAAWHAGSSTTKPKLNGKGNLNKWTIGIELCNWGWLYESIANCAIKIDGKTYERKAGLIYTRFRQWTYEYHGEKPTAMSRISQDNPAVKNNKFWPGGDVLHWEPYTLYQIESLETLLRGIVMRYPNITRKWIATHADVDPTRKLDIVGNVLPLSKILENVYRNEAAEKFKPYQLGDESASVNEMKEMHEPRTHKCSLF